MPLVLYDSMQVTRWLGARSIAKAKNLIDKVQNIQRLENLLVGEVDGARSEPWMVMVHFGYPRGKLHASGECTCPVRTNCRHVAAVMLANLLQQKMLHRSEPARFLAATPTPQLHLESRSDFVSGYGRYGHRQKRLDFATIHFNYGGVLIAPENTEKVYRDDDGHRWIVERHFAREQAWLAELEHSELIAIPRDYIYTPASAPLPGLLYVTVHPEQWRQIIRQTLPALQRCGWHIIIDNDFTWNHYDIDDVRGEVRQHEEGKIDIEFIAIAGERRIALLPMLLPLLAQDNRWRSGSLNTIPDDELIELRHDSGERFAIGASKLKQLVRNFVDLLSEEVLLSNHLQLTMWETGRLTALKHNDYLLAYDKPSLEALSVQLCLPDVEPPRGLKATLRDYQLHGVSWLQYLRTHQLAGILADEMGLGKTIQVLAHMLLEKEQGRLDRPVLIIMPTTLVYNWLSEAQRFAPGLRMLALSGPERSNHFAYLAEYDVVVTTYALLWRDQNVLADQRWHQVILDESQYAKNPSARVGRAIRRLKTRYRLCLTGTPLENHLGELWAQFDFLMPGWLGSEQSFMREWRIPVEREGDNTRRDLLACRIHPYVLRRRKQEVVKELPSKISMVRNVQLEGAQRELYERVQLTMTKQLRQTVTDNNRGAGRILILNALLKLRQICCDPRLTGLKYKELSGKSAKLTLLLDMLQELLSQDRHILIFSQFAEMLALIAGELKKADIGYVMLTGNTRNRQTPVEHFQSGAVSVFLISLKAGGVGLNLTAADTVIHYDPWWNPAAENQATDRAWRIGQKKTVFVYKLIMSGSIEEKIVNLQQQKMSLAEDVLTKNRDGGALYSDEELAELLTACHAIYNGSYR